ncbi:MAG: glycosyltransferase family 2 protein [Candidatus Lutacidiplasmatales archaeon]
MSRRLPTISLVTPSLNQGRFLRATIESVLSQGYPSLEYFVQDGGSTDESLAILRDYEGRVPFVSEKDSGQADAINRGLSRTTGEVLGYLNSDDLLLPGALRAVGETFATDPNLVMVYGQAVFISADGQPLGKCLTQEWEPRRLGDACFVTQPAAFWRRRVGAELGPFDVSLHHTMDYDYWLRIADRYPAAAIRYLQRDLAAARWHDGAKTVTRWDRALEEIIALVERRRGYVSLWWLVAKWDYRLDGRSQVTDPHPVPWRAYYPAVYEYVRRNRMPVWLRGLRGSPRGLAKRLRMSLR